MISEPTHDRGKVLDLLLCNTPGLISNITVLEKDQVCKSDHFAIKFTLNAKLKRKKNC